MNFCVCFFVYICEAGFNANERRGNMTEFEELLMKHYQPLERFVAYRIDKRYDAEDVMQDICLTASAKFSSLKNRSSFKAWIISIARNKCNDYYRSRSDHTDLSLDAVAETAMVAPKTGMFGRGIVAETLEMLGEKEKEILYLFFYEDLPQSEIAKRLGVPIGTVKSRLYHAKEKFRRIYPCPPKSKGENKMEKLPEIMPEYRIERSELTPFSVRWEELQGWLIVPRIGQKLTWGMYDFPERRRTEYTEMEVIGKAEVHGIEGVEIVAMQYDSADYYRTGALDRVERRFVAQLTDTHTKYLAEMHMEDGVRKCYTFLDGEMFLKNWGYGEDNCGNETDLRPKGLLVRQGDFVTGTVVRETVDVVGRYNVTICGKTYDTVCVLDIECFNDAVASEQFVDKNGRTVLWRRFNRNDWAYGRYGKLWTEMLPDNECLTINGETYVHWYDCISDYIL